MAKFSLSEKITTCNAKNTRFETDACKHYLEICNLCDEQTFCIDHGCTSCGLKKDENNGALSVLPDEERLLLLIVEEQRQHLTPQKKIATKKAIRPLDYYRTLYLQDILDLNALNNYS